MTLKDLRIEFKEDLLNKTGKEFNYSKDIPEYIFWLENKIIRYNNRFRFIKGEKKNAKKEGKYSQDK